MKTSKVKWSNYSLIKLGVMLLCLADFPIKILNLKFWTGCGKKRSSNAPVPQESDPVGQELDALARHVLSEARLYEQLQSKVSLF